MGGEGSSFEMRGVSWFERVATISTTHNGLHESIEPIRIFVWRNRADFMLKMMKKGKDISKRNHAKIQNAPYPHSSPSIASPISSCYPKASGYL